MVQLKRRKGDGKEDNGVVSKSWPTVARQNEKREALLAGANRGVGVFNTSGLLIDCNVAYGETYGLPEELVVPGTSLVEILEHQVGMGNIPGSDSNDYVIMHLNMSRKNEPQTRVETLPDGRVLSIGHIPVNGGGWITTLDDISDLYAIVEEMEHSSFYDRRTALPNHKMLMQSLDNAFAQQWEEESFALIAVDFSAFDGLVDPESELQLHTHVADRLAKTVRTGDVPAKLEGSNFAVLQSAVTTADDAEALARRLATLLAMPYQVGEQTLMPSFHMGIALPGQDDIGEKALLEQAQQAAKQARAIGQKRYAFYIEEKEALSA
ncbi:MAG: PAS-domain containing protein [Rhizobiaceae bacterium]